MSLIGDGSQHGNIDTTRIAIEFDLKSIQTERNSKQRSKQNILDDLTRLEHLEKTIQKNILQQTVGSEIEDKFKQYIHLPNNKSTSQLCNFSNFNETTLDKSQASQQSGKISKFRQKTTSQSDIIQQSAQITYSQLRKVKSTPRLVKNNFISCRQLSRQKIRQSVKSGSQTPSKSTTRNQIESAIENEFSENNKNPTSTGMSTPTPWEELNLEISDIKQSELTEYFQDPKHSSNQSKLEMPPEVKVELEVSHLQENTIDMNIENMNADSLTENQSINIDFQDVGKQLSVAPDHHDYIDTLPVDFIESNNTYFQKNNLSIECPLAKNKERLSNSLMLNAKFESFPNIKFQGSNKSIQFKKNLLVRLPIVEPILGNLNDRMQENTRIQLPILTCTPKTDFKIFSENVKHEFNPSEIKKKLSLEKTREKEFNLVQSIIEKEQANFNILTHVNRGHPTSHLDLNIVLNNSLNINKDKLKIKTNCFNVWENSLPESKEMRRYWWSNSLIPKSAIEKSEPEKILTCIKNIIPPIMKEQISTAENKSKKDFKNILALDSFVSSNVESFEQSKCIIFSELLKNKNISKVPSGHNRKRRIYSEKARIVACCIRAHSAINILPSPQLRPIVLRRHPNLEEEEYVFIGNLNEKTKKTLLEQMNARKRLLMYRRIRKENCVPQAHNKDYTVKFDESLKEEMAEVLNNVTFNVKKGKLKFIRKATPISKGLKYYSQNSIKCEVSLRKSDMISAEKNLERVDLAKDYANTIPEDFNLNDIQEIEFGENIKKKISALVPLPVQNISVVREKENFSGMFKNNIIHLTSEGWNEDGSEINPSPNIRKLYQRGKKETESKKFSWKSFGRTNELISKEQSKSLPLSLKGYTLFHPRSSIDVEEHWEEDAECFPKNDRLSKHKNINIIKSRNQCRNEKEVNLENSVLEMSVMKAILNIPRRATL
ncbi:hypothetical protein HK096_002242 [Nowakowskiella sp. JEL0078]|nr:hypothetical protein HK096_002242 [Nowakowskiella sp. JEL0078]